MRSLHTWAHKSRASLAGVEASLAGVEASWRVCRGAHGVGAASVHSGRAGALRQLQASTRGRRLCRLLPGQ